MRYTALAQKTNAPGCAVEGEFPPSFYHPYALAVQKVFLLCCTLRDEARAAGCDPGVCGLTYRLKTPASIGEKLLSRGYPATHDAADACLHDVAGLRVILKCTQQVYAFSKLLAASPQVRLIATRDYIAHPKESGYRSLHLILRVQVSYGGVMRSVPVEVQLRTSAMDIWASIEHDVVYKPIS